MLKVFLPILNQKNQKMSKLLSIIALGCFLICLISCKENPTKKVEKNIDSGLKSAEKWFQAWELIA